jgi:hypothetical protein
LTPIFFYETESPFAFTKEKVAPRIDQTVFSTKIQSTFREFCFRNSNPLEKMRIIHQVNLDADKIGQRFTNVAQTQLIVENEDERLKLDNWMMSLLLGLDAI